MAEHTRNSRSSPEGGLRDISSEKSSVYFDVLFPSGNCNPNRKTANKKSKLQPPPLNEVMFCCDSENYVFHIRWPTDNWGESVLSVHSLKHLNTAWDAAAHPSQPKYNIHILRWIQIWKEKCVNAQTAPMSDKGVTLHRLTISFSDSALSFLQTAAIFKFCQFQQMWRRHEWYMQKFNKILLAQFLPWIYSIVFLKSGQWSYFLVKDIDLCF